MLYIFLGFLILLLWVILCNIFNLNDENFKIKEYFSDEITEEERKERLENLNTALVENKKLKNRTRNKSK